jgi:hypothetical protein
MHLDGFRPVHGGPGYSTRRGSARCAAQSGQVRLRLVPDPDEVTAPGAQDMPQAAGAAQAERQCFGQQPDLGHVRVVGRPL